MSTLLRKIEVKLNYARYALQKMNKPHLGDLVTHKGKRCFLNQGVADPYWDLVHRDETGSTVLYGRVHVSEFKIDQSIKRKLWAFRSSYKFKMDNWYLIDTWGRIFGSPISNV